MARNGSGTYTVPNTFVAGAIITASDHNENWSDSGSEISNSLALDGQSTMTGAFKASSGTAAAPSITFGSDTDTGLYRSAADTIGVAVGGAAVGSIDSAGFKSSAGNKMDAFASGTAMLFVQTSAPTGWTKVTSLDNAAIRLVSGTASSGGTADFTTALAARTIAQANLPSVSLTTTISAGAGSHTHTANTNSNAANTTANGSTTSIGQGTFYVAGGTPAVALVSGTISAATLPEMTGTTPLGGSGTAMDFAVKYKDVIHATKD